MPVSALNSLWGPSDQRLQKSFFCLGIDFSEKVCVDIVTSNSLHFCFFNFLFRCRNLTFPDRLPEVSIVFIFVNEALSVILRSIHSAIDRTPAHLLKEIILVDDNSNNGKRFLVFFFFFLNLFSSYRGWIIHENPWILAPIHPISISDVFSIFFSLSHSTVLLGFVFKYTLVGRLKKTMYKDKMPFLFVLRWLLSRIWGITIDYRPKMFCAS